jgi:hypothetical protein
MMVTGDCACYEQGFLFNRLDAQGRWPLPPLLLAAGVAAFESERACLARSARPPSNVASMKMAATPIMI